MLNKFTIPHENTNAALFHLLTETLATSLTALTYLAEMTENVDGEDTAAILNEKKQQYLILVKEDLFERFGNLPDGISDILSQE